MAGLALAGGALAALTPPSWNWIAPATGEGATAGRGALAAAEPVAASAATAREPAAAASAPAAPSPGALRTRPLSAWLADVAREGRRELVVSPEVKGDLTATGGEGLPWQERLAAYARVFAFEYELAPGLIEVRPKPSGAGRAREVEVDAGEFPGDVERVAGGAPEPPLATQVIALAHAPAKEVAAVVARAAAEAGVGVAADVASNSVALSGAATSLGAAASLVRSLDRPRRRVLLEAKIVEVARSARDELGIQWKIGKDASAAVDFPADLGDAGSAALAIASGGAAVDARIAALEADGRLRVVSRPRVVMLEGSPATIESVRILRIRLPSRGAVVGDEVVEAPASERATEEIPVGVRLEVTPAVRAGERVLLRIRAKSSSLGAPLPPDDIPEELSRMVDAEILVASGETAVLGGLLREAGSKSGAGVPGLRRVPVFGGLFGRRARETESEELLVLVTPRVLE